MKEKNFIGIQQAQQSVGTDYLQQAMQNVDSEKEFDYQDIIEQMWAELSTLVARKRKELGLDCTKWTQSMVVDMHSMAEDLTNVVMVDWDERKFVVGEKDAAGK